MSKDFELFYYRIIRERVVFCPIAVSTPNSSTSNKNLSATKNFAKGGKIASPASPVDTASITASAIASQTASLDKTTASPNKEEQNTSTASTAYQERVTASANGSQSKSLTFEKV